MLLLCTVRLSAIEIKMSEENKPVINEQVLTATLHPTQSHESLQIFEKKEEGVIIKEASVQATPETVSEGTETRQSASSQVDQSAIFEKKNKKMIVLGSVTEEEEKARLVAEQEAKEKAERLKHQKARKSTSPRHPRNTETPQSLLSDDSAPVKVKEPSESLMRATAARVRDSQVLEDRKREKETAKSPSRRKSDNGSASYTPSERLLRPTQARVMDVKEWEAHKERSKYEDDIWWELRKPNETAKPNPNTPSKLYENTAAFSKQIRNKYDPATAAVLASPPREVHIPAKIDDNSPLLKKTTAAKVQTWRQTEIVQESPKPVLKLVSNQSGPHHVESKLFYDTKASQLQKYKSKEEAEKELEKKTASPASGKKVKGVSPRLLELNESLKNSVRPKYDKVEGDRRESGWTTVRKTHIPTIEEMHDTLVRSSGSVVYSHRDSSGSAFDSRDHEDDHHENNHLEPDQPEEGEEEEENQPEQESHEVFDNHEEHPEEENLDLTTAQIEQVTAELAHQTLEVN